MAFRVQMQVLGAAAVYANLRQLEMRFWPGLTRAAEAAGRALVQETTSQMQAQSVPGPPGGYPAVRSGQLVGSIDYEIENRTLTFGSRGAFNRGFDYAVAQQVGTSKMAARPYLTLTVNRLGHSVGRIMATRVWHALVGGG